MLRVTPIYGSRYDAEGSAQAPSCTLVEYGGVKVLCNVGWWATSSGSNNQATITEGLDAPVPLASSSPSSVPFPTLPDHDCCILTDSTLNSLGGLPLYYQRHILPRKEAEQSQDDDADTDKTSVPMIYATFPTVKMGQMSLYDFHANMALDGSRPPFSLEEMDNAFAHLQTIKYSQTILVAPQGQSKPSLAITAHLAGHVVGGAFYVLQRLQDETIVVVTPPTYNIAKEGHLDSATLLKYGATPDVLVTYPGGPAFKYLTPLYYPPKGSKANASPMKALTTRTGATKHLLETILSVLRRDGHVLLPVDASGRVLELLLLLSQHWDRQRLGAAYNLCWLGPMVQNTLDFCRSQLEWMASKLGHQMDDTKGGKQQEPAHPFALRNVQLCCSVQELDAVIRQNNNNPTCVLASGLSLDHGPARDLLLRWADNADNAIIFTDSSQCVLRQQQTSSDPTSDNMEVEQPSQEQAQQPAASVTQPPLQRQASATTQPPLQRQASTATAATTATTEAGATAADQAEDDDNETGAIGAAIEEGQVSKYTAGAQLLHQWCHAKYEGREMDDSVLVDVQVPHRAPLAGPALKQFLAQEEAARQLQQQQEEQRAMLREVEIAKGQLRLGEQQQTTTQAASALDGEETTKAGGKATGSAVTSSRPKKKSRFDSTLFIKFSKPLHLTFEVREEAVGVGQSDSTAKYGIGESIGRSGEVLEDDYGIAVIPERFTDIVSGVDPSKFAGGSGRIGEEVLRRGFGFGAVGPKGGGGGAGGAGGNLANEDEGDLEDEMDEQALEAGDLAEGNGIIRGRNGRQPTKVTTVPRRLEVLAEIAFVPLEGRVDARAARQSVRALQPRQVVVLGGPAPKDSISEQKPKDSGLTMEVVDEVNMLAEAAQSFATDRSSKVLTPSDGETAELSVGHAAYSVRLLDTPHQTRQEKAMNAEKGIDPPEPVEPFEIKVGACTVSLIDTVATGQKVALDGSIVLAPRPLTRAIAMNHPSIYVSDGEVLLTDLRAELIAQSMKAEYSAKAGYSQLVVNGKIIVKKGQDSGRLEIEGPLCEDFYTVRSVMCGQYVTL